MVCIVTQVNLIGTLLVGVIVALSELAVFLALRNRNKNRTERNKHYEKYVKTDEKYWTDWGE